jgi:pimeloyl-ACP methyl ester carboxylesterase
VVLLPGLLTTPQIWDPVQDALAQHGWMSHAAMCPALETVKAIVDELATSLPERCHLVGFSFGGYVALTMLDNYPELVASLCLVGSGGHCDSQALRVFRQQCIDEVAAGNFLSVSARSVEAALVPVASGTPELLQRAVKMWRMTMVPTALLPICVPA